MDRIYASGAAGSAPSVPASPSSGYPTAGNPGTGTPATKPGPYWYHMIMEELMAIISAAGITPAQGNLTQLLTALRSSGVFQTPAQFDGSTKAATTAFVQRALGNLQGELAFNVDTALSVSAFGRLVIFAGTATANRTFTLPKATDGAAGSCIYFWNNSAYSLTVVPFAGDTLDTGTSTPASIVLGPGDSLTAETFSVSTYRIIGGSAQLKNTAVFGASLAPNSYQKLPSGLIVQWGTFNPTAGTDFTSTSVMLPIAFPSVHIGTVVTANGLGDFANVTAKSLTGFTARVQDRSSAQPVDSTAFYISLGY